MLKPYPPLHGNQSVYKGVQQIQRDCTAHDLSASNYTNHRQVLTVGSSDCIDNTELSHSESNNTRVDATRVSIAGIELVTAGNVRKPGLCDEVVEEGQVKVTGHSEDIGDADLDWSANKVATQSSLGRVDHDGVAIVGPFGRGCLLHSLQAYKLKALRFWCPWIAE
ncbi:unnamed protein product [Prunus armeniaca]